MEQGARKSHGHDQALASDTFDKFCNASTLKDILALYRQLCSICKLVPTNFQEFFPKIRGKIPSWRAEELWSRFEKKAAEKCYARGRYCANTKVLIIGAGPCGLRAAIDAQLLGAKVVVIEKRDKLSRNNVLHLWPFVITDLRALGAKVLYGKFCAGSIDHISIRQIQCILLKVALLLGVEFYEGVGFQGLREPMSSAVDDGWRAQITPPTHPVAQYQFDVVLGADGRQSILSSEGFKRKALRAKLAIAITANFINKHTEAEAKVEEISGVSYIFRQQFFQDMDDAMGIALENIVYYKDETHYFVMTPKKQSLLEKGVLYQDFPEPELLLSPENVDQEALQRFTMEAVVFATDNRLPSLEFALNHYGQPDVAVFDFTTMYASENACRAVQRKGHKLLIGLIGDALLEPFWPTGSGCARGFLSSLDACWMIRQWGKGLNSVLEVLAERESVYRMLGQTTPENLNKDHSQYTVDPRTRYPKINMSAVHARQIQYLFDSDVPIQDIFDPIRDPNNKARKEFVMPEDFLVRWLQEQLGSSGLSSVCDIVNGANALHKLLYKFRPDLIPEYPIPPNIDPMIRNQLLFEILQEEFDLHLPMDCEKSVRCGDGERSVLTRYLSQIYLRFKGDIPRDDIYDSRRFYNAMNGNNNKTVTQYPNNSKLHHSLSIKEFLRAKEQLEKNRKDQDDNNQSRREKRRSQFYDALMQSESQKNGNNGGGSGGGLQRSQTTVNVVIPIVKLNPVPPGELFAACRQGRDKEIASENRPASVASSNPNAQKVLTRSRSDVGFRRGPSPALTMAGRGGGGGLGIGPGQLRKSSSGNNHNLANLEEQEQNTAEALEMQMKIMKRRTTPAGNIISTFMQKQAIANEMLATPQRRVGGGVVVVNSEEQENWTKRQIRDMRARSLSTFNGWGKKPGDDEEQKNNELNNHFKLKQQQQKRKENSQQQQQNNNQQQQPLGLGPDVSFKDRCKFLERNIYNSGRDFKVHCSAAPWFSEEGKRTSPINNYNINASNTLNIMKSSNNSSKASSPVSPTKTSPTPSLIPGSGSPRVPLQKSPTSATVVVPGVPGVSTCFMASKKQQQPPPPQQLAFISNKANENFTSINPFQQQQQQKKFQNSNIPRIQQQQQQQQQLTFQQQLQQQRDAIERRLGATIAGIKTQVSDSPTPYHINGQIIHPGNGNRNNRSGNNGNGSSVVDGGGASDAPADNNNNNPVVTTSMGLRTGSSSPPSSPNYQQHHGPTTTPQQSRTSSGSNSPNGHMLPQSQLRRSATSIGVHSNLGNHLSHNSSNLYSPSIVMQANNGNRHLARSRTGRNIMQGNNRKDSSGESDTDTEFLKQIDFETIDGQELQELLSSF